MKKYLVKICMITLMVISFGIINGNHVYAETETIKNEGTFFLHVPKENIYVNDYHIKEAWKTIVYYTVDESGIYEISLDAPSKLYDIDVYEVINEGWFDGNKWDDIEAIDGEENHKKKLKVYFEKGKKYDLDFSFKYCPAEDFNFSFVSKLIEKKVYKGQLSVSSSGDLTKIKGVSFDKKKNTLTLNNAYIDKPILIDVAKEDFLHAYRSPSTFKIIVKGVNKIHSIKIFSDYNGIEDVDYIDMDISGGGTLEVLSSYSPLEVNSLNVENVKIIGEKLLMQYGKAKYNNVKFDVCLSPTMMGGGIWDDWIMSYYNHLDYDKIFYRFNGFDGYAEYENCVFDFKYCFVEPKNMKDNIIFAEFENCVAPKISESPDTIISKFTNCSMIATIDKNLVDQHKDFYKKNAENLKITYNPIDHKTYFSEGKKLNLRDLLNSFYCKITDVPLDGEKYGEIEILNSKYFKLMGRKEFIEDEFSDPICDYISFRVSKYGKKTFSGIKSLKKVQIGSDSLKEIGSYAFSNNKNLKTVVIKGNKLSKIRKGAFSKNTKLKYVRIESKKVVKIGKGAFAGSKKKIKFVVPKKLVKKYKKALKRAKVKNFVVKGLKDKKFVIKKF